MKKRLIRLLVLSVFALTVAAVIALIQIKNDTHMRRGENTTSVAVANFGGDFTLKNQDGVTVTQDDFKGQYRLIYFGFTYCPAICPTELQKIASALDMAGEKGKKVLPVFVTVDPARDTVSVMKEYTALFHPRLVGLTGTTAQIQQAMDAYKIYAAKVQDETMSDYTMDHSSFIYFIGPDDTLYHIFKMADPARDIADAIRGKVK